MGDSRRARHSHSVPPTIPQTPRQASPSPSAQPAEVIYFTTLRIIHKTFISEFMNLAGNSRRVLLCASARAFDHAAFMCCIIDHNDSRILPICWHACASAYYMVERANHPQIAAAASCQRVLGVRMLMLVACTIGNGRGYFRRICGVYTVQYFNNLVQHKLLLLLHVGSSGSSGKRKNVHLETP